MNCKKIKTAIISAVILIMMISLSVACSAAYLGDVNSDGKVTAADARSILRHSAKIERLSDTAIKIADIDGNGNITAADARIALRMSAKLESLFADNEKYHVHNYAVREEVKATCDADGFTVKACVVCGKEEKTVIKGGHDFSEATCTEPKRCKRCGVTEGEALGHDFATEYCETHYKCKRCGKFSENIKKHTLTRSANGDLKCSNCGRTLDVESYAINAVKDLQRRLKNPNSLILNGIKYSIPANEKTEQLISIVIDYSAMNGFGGYNRDTAWYCVTASGALRKEAVYASPSYALDITNIKKQLNIK